MTFLHVEAYSEFLVAQDLQSADLMGDRCGNVSVDGRNSRRIACEVDVETELQGPMGYFEGGW